jgi:tRNA modification GTPase
VHAPSFVVVQLTPPGRGAVATLRAEGSGALAAVDAEFRPASGRPLSTLPTDRIAVGRFGPMGEEMVASRCGNEAVELHCHGGAAAVAAVEETLVARGGQVVGWREWVGGCGNSYAAVAWPMLACAPTLRTAAILLDQYHGALGRALDDIRSLAAVDPAVARDRCDELLARANLGRHLTSPWRVVLAGRPNVGKSSLLNAMVGYTRAIVHHEPGTTRDLVTADAALNGWPIELCDTAGLRSSVDSVEQAGVARAEQSLAAADLVLWIVDRSVPAQSDDVAIPVGALLVQNKCDLPAARFASNEGLAVSALGGEGIELLLAAIVARLVPVAPAPGAAVPIDDAQVAAIGSLRAALP